MGEHDVEILVVDDGSTDGSAHHLAHLNLPMIRVLTHPQRLGSGVARSLGTRSSRGSYIAWIDGDGTYDPEDIYSLHRLLVDNHGDQIIGVRSCDHGRLRWLRWNVKRALCILVTVLWRTKIPDLNSGLRVFRREAAEAVLPDLPSGFSCTSTATLSALNRRHAVSFAPIRYYARKDGCPSKFNPITDGWRLLRVIMRMLFTSRKNSATRKTSDAG